MKNLIKATDLKEGQIFKLGTESYVFKLVRFTGLTNTTNGTEITDALIMQTETGEVFETFFFKNEEVLVN